MVYDVFQKKKKIGIRILVLQVIENGFFFEFLLQQDKIFLEYFFLFETSEAPELCIQSALNNSDENLYFM